MNFFKRNSMPDRAQKGYTLIELMMVVAILAALTVVVTTKTGQVIQKARDSKRKADVNAIRAALVLYLEDRGSFKAMTDADGASATLGGQNFRQAYYYSTPIHPAGAGRNDWSRLAQHLKPFLSLPMDPKNRFTDWGALTPNYSGGNLPHGYYMVGVTDRAIVQPVCGGNTIRLEYLVEAPLDNPLDPITNGNKSPALFSCYPGWKDVMTVWDNQ